MAGQHADHVAVGIFHREGEVDETIGFAIGPLLEQVGQQLRFVNVADGKLVHPFLEPGPCGNRRALQDPVG